jgi:hypothetical protein
MKDEFLGWLYCWSYTMEHCCRHKLTNAHWHRVYRGHDGEPKIFWESIHMEPEEGTAKFFCHHCKKDITNEDHMFPHYIPLFQGLYFCDACMKELYPKQWEEAHRKGHGCWGFTGEPTISGGHE